MYNEKRIGSANGTRFLGSLIRTSNARLEELSRREQEIANILYKTNKEIGMELGLTEHTVKNYFYRALKKMNAKNRTELLYLINKASQIDYSYLLSHLRPLSRRETETLNLVSKGKTNRETGMILGMSHTSVRNCVAIILFKAHASKRTELVFLGIALEQKARMEAAAKNQGLRV